MSSNHFLFRFSFRRKTTQSSTANLPLSIGVEDGARKELITDKRGALGLNLLYGPSHPVVNFVFVHGLGGGSRKTWSKTAATEHYWPQTWLPADPEFSRVQILSYGYDSDWVKSKSNVLNVHHFSKALLADLSTSPYLQNGQVPIVLIGHSMGGCIIKKAYMLAKQDMAFVPLAQRIRNIVFLATPHRGADLAKTLARLLPKSRRYVKDLQKCSEALQTINDEFRHCPTDMILWSFYETQKIGWPRKLIVDVDSAILGYKEERQIPMTADHRSICKFDNTRDPNYVLIRNSFATIIQNVQVARTVLGDVSQSKNIVHDQIHKLREYLTIKGEIHDDFDVVNDARLAGSCEWLSDRKGFRDWCNFNFDSAPLLWINGQPATGKSVLAGYAVSQLQNSKVQCSYFFFKYGDKSKSKLSTCLKSLAFQMACHSDQVRTALLQLQADDNRLDKETDRRIWRTLFVNTIFQTLSEHHFWIIDALDECTDAATFFENILPTLNSSFPLRILITSRNSPRFERLFHSLVDSLGQHRVQTEAIATEDTLCDIKLLIEARGKQLICAKDEERNTIMNRIMDKSSGSFLWTVLVMNELAKAHTVEEAQEVLEDIPSEIKPLYERALKLMSPIPRHRTRIKAILRWATCALRPLTIQELSDALKIEFRESFPKLAESIHALCCQLVIVDRFGRVQMVHETARQFLLDEELRSEFAIRKGEACSEIVKVCLKYLVSDDLKPPRSGRRGSAPNITNGRSKFSDYACFAFADHLVQADPQANDILGLIEKFLASNILSWIEVVAEARDLDFLIRTSRRFKTYSNNIAACRSPLSREFGIIRGWAVDLVRVTARFGEALVLCPWSIYSLVGPFCPSTSSISNVAAPSRKISVAGVSRTQWDDRLSSISFQEQTSAIGHGDSFFAIGLTSGRITIYHADSCQEFRVLEHGEAIKFLQFKLRTSLLASCGARTVKVWDLRTGAVVHSSKAPPGPLSMAFDDNNLMVASCKKYIASWNLSSPVKETSYQPWRDSYEGGQESHLLPCVVTISIGHKMLAAGYTKGSITLWDIETNKFHSTCCATMSHGGENARRVTALVLNPNPDLDLLAVSYLDGLLVLQNPYEDKTLATFRANCLTLASSSNGQLLAAGAGRGLVQIYAFETLQLLYQVQTQHLYIKQLTFSHDHLRLIDIRGSHCNIWEPPVLLREIINDDCSEQSSWSMVEGVALDTTVRITSLCLHPNEKIIFCGRDDGLVSTYSVDTGLPRETLYKHKSRIRILVFWLRHNVLISVDDSNMLSIWHMQEKGSQDLGVEQLTFQSHMVCEGSIFRVLVGDTSGKFILSTRSADYLHGIDGQRQKALVRSEQHEARQWVNDPQDPSRVLCIDSQTIDLYSWDNWTRLASFPLMGELTRLQLKSVQNYQSEARIGLLLSLYDSDALAGIRLLQLYDAASLRVGSSAGVQDFDDAKTVAREKPYLLHEKLLVALTEVYCQTVGVTKNGRLVFIDKSSWVCSADLSLSSKFPTSYRRHFFVPRDWFSGMPVILSDLWDEDVIFTHNADVAVVKGGLHFFEEVYLF